MSLKMVSATMGGKSSWLTRSLLDAATLLERHDSHLNHKARIVYGVNALCWWLLGVAILGWWLSDPVAELDLTTLTTNQQERLPPSSLREFIIPGVWQPMMGDTEVPLELAHILHDTDWPLRVRQAFASMQYLEATPNATLTDKVDFLDVFKSFVEADFIKMLIAPAKPSKHPVFSSGVGATCINRTGLARRGLPDNWKCMISPWPADSSPKEMAVQTNQRVACYNHFDVFTLRHNVTCVDHAQATRVAKTGKVLDLTKQF